MNSRRRTGVQRWWWPAVAGLTLIGLGIRLAAVYTHPIKKLGGDASIYHGTANLLAHGVFYVNVPVYQTTHQQLAAASYPPLFSAVLAVPSLFGLTSVLAARVWCCVLGAAAVPLGALLGQRLASRRAGMIAGALIALYPNLWMSDGLVLSEALTPVMVLLVLLAAYHLWRRRTLAAAALFGGTVALAALNHDELALLGPLILLPLVLGERASWRHRLSLLGIGALVFGLIVGPWVGWNLSRFSRPVYLSDGVGPTLLSGDCGPVWSGTYTGYWTIQCALPKVPNGDESVQSAHDQTQAIRYVKHHLGSLPRVTAAKVGRGLGLYRPIQQVQLDHFIESRPQLWAYVGLGAYYVLAPLSIIGAVILHRRGIPIYPMVAVGVIVVVTMALSFGQTRYRTALEVPVTVLAAVAVDAAVARLRRRHVTTEPTAAVPTVRESVGSL